MQLNKRQVIRIFTLWGGRGEVEVGATVGKYYLKGAGISIPAIMIGERGRGRKLGVMPVQLEGNLKTLWDEKGAVRVKFGYLDKTRSGKYKLVVPALNNPRFDENFCLVIVRANIGFRGYNAITGAERLYAIPKLLWWEEIVELLGERAKLEKIPLGDVPPDAEYMFDFAYSDFPGEVLITGKIAQGEAGRMGAGMQYIALFPRNRWARMYIGGKTYGAPHEYYFSWKGEDNFICLSAEDWELYLDMEGGQQ